MAAAALVEQYPDSGLATDDEVEFGVLVHVDGVDLEAGADAAALVDRVTRELFRLGGPVVVVDAGLVLRSRVAAGVGANSLAGDELVLPVAVEVGPVKAVRL
ncbi:MAG: hypothetical protein AAF517_22290 [Planctomycetota bacterium]